MRIPSHWALGAGVIGVVAVSATQCGGATTSTGSDASTDGSGSNGGSLGSSSSGSSTGSSSGSGGGSSSTGSGGGCSPACGPGFTCCGTQCINPNNDPHNCGGCGIVCSGATPCEQDAAACGGGSCCGQQCCGQGQLCCLLEQGPWFTQCYTPTGGATSCPAGCPQCVSDRNVKRDIEPVDARAVLESVARLPVSTWSYKSDDPSVRHMGPMAQDFKAAFGLGDTDRAYYPIDAHGVTLASIQALYERMQELDVRIQRLEQENKGLRDRCP
jgi:hypothetical protein